MSANSRTPLWAGLTLLAVTLILYMATLDNGLQPHEVRGGDLITHQYAQVQARPSNAPGYPLYTMGGWLWFHALRRLPFYVTGRSNPIPLLSSYSTLWALLALALFYAVLLRVTRSSRFPHGNWPVAWLVSAFYAVTYFFWFYATTTEQYSSAVAQTLALLYVYLLWCDAADAPDPVTDETGSRRADRLLLLLAFLCGLSLAHMLTIAFFVPPLVAVILWQKPDLLRRPRMLAGTIIAAALPLVSYLYVYVRGAQHPEWRGSGNWAGANEWFWSFVSTAQGREELGWAFEPGTTFFANGFPQLIWQELSVPLLVLGLVGILLFDRRLKTFLYGGILSTVLFSWAYRYGNWFQVILPVYPLILLGDAAIADWLMIGALRRVGQSRSIAWRVAATAPLFVLSAMLVWRLNGSLPAANSRNRSEDTALQRAAVLLDQTLPAHAGLFAAVDDALALHYLLDIWQLQRGAVDVASSSEAARLLQRGESVVSTIDAVETLLGELPSDLQPRVQMLSPDWMRLDLVPEPHPGSMKFIPVGGEVEPGVQLEGYHVQPAPSGSPLPSLASGGLDVFVRWKLVDGVWPDGLAISVRPVAEGDFIPDPDTEPGAIIQRDASAPARGLWYLAPDSPGAGNGQPARLFVDAYRLPAAAVSADAVPRHPVPVNRRGI